MQFVKTVLWLAWYIRLIRFENSIRNRIGRPIRFEIRFECKKTIRKSLTYGQLYLAARPQPDEALVCLALLA